MLHKSFTATAELSKYAPQLDRFLSEIARANLRVASGSYTGTHSELKITTSFTPRVVLIAPATFALTGLMFNPGDSNLDTNGYPGLSEIGFDANAFKIKGSSTSLNTAGTTYFYLIIG